MRRAGSPTINSPRPFARPGAHFVPSMCSRIVTSQLVDRRRLGSYDRCVEVVEARALACRLLADEQPQRWDHVQGVANQAARFTGLIDNWEALVCAAYVHDIGYASEAIDIGFHQIDGARYLRRLGWSEAVVNLVAHHSGAQIRGELAGHGPIYATEFPADETLPHRHLHFCDLTVALDGAPTTVEERLADMRSRHSHNRNMIQFLDGHEQSVIAMVEEIQRLLEPGTGPGARQTLSAT